MTKYEIKTDLQGEQSIWATYEDGRVSIIPMDESNADYNQYLIDIDGAMQAAQEEPVLPPTPPAEEPVAPEQPVDPTI